MRERMWRIVLSRDNVNQEHEYRLGTLTQLISYIKEAYSSVEMGEEDIYQGIHYIVGTWTETHYAYGIVDMRISCTSFTITRLPAVRA